MAILPQDEFDEIFDEVPAQEKPIVAGQVAPQQGAEQEIVTQESPQAVAPEVPPSVESSQPPQSPPIEAPAVQPAVPATQPATQTATYEVTQESPTEQEVAPPVAAQQEQPQPVDFLTGLVEQVRNDPEIRSYIDDYPEIAGPQMKLLATTLEKVIGAIATELDKRDALIASTLNPVINEYRTRQEQAHYDKILSVHPDAADLVSSGAVEDWIKRQPKFAQDAFMKVYTQGGADDVIELLNQFKAANVPINPPTQRQEQMMMAEAKQQAQLEAQQGQPQAQIVPQAQPTLSPADQQKLAMIETVKRKGATEPKTSKAVDFDTAFEEAIKGLM